MSDRPRTSAYCPDPVFVVGSPRSGTTAVAWAIGEHSRFFAGDETHFLWELFSGNRLEHVYDRWSARPSSSWLRREQVSRAEFFEAAGLGFNTLFTRSSGERRWVDQTPHHCHMADTLAAMFPGGRFVHVLRDGREVVNSMINIGRTMEPEECAAMRSGGFLPPWADDFRAACVTWRDTVRAALDFCDRMPERSFRLLHHDLERDPGGTIAGLMRFLGEDDEPGPASFLRRRRINSSFAPPGGMPNDQYVRPDPWPTWTPEERATFVDVAGSEMSRCGFFIDSVSGGLTSA